MKTSLLFLCVLLSFSSLAQEKQLKKLDQLFDQSITSFSKKNYQKTLDLIEESEKIVTEHFPDNTQLQLGLIGQKALVYDRIGSFRALQELYEQEAQIILDIAGSDNKLFLENQLNQAYNAQRLGNFETSDSLFRNLDAPYASMFGSESIEYASFLKFWSNLHYYLGRYDEALTINRQLLTLYTKKLGERALQTTIALNNIGTTLLSQDKLDSALYYLDQSEEVLASTVGSYDDSYGAVLYNIGLVYLEKADAANALDYFKRALDVRERILGDAHPEYALTLVGQGRAQLASDQPQRALKSYEEALTVFVSALGERHPRTTKTLGRLAELHDKIGNKESSLLYYRRTLDNVNFLIEHIFTGLSLSEQAAYYYSIKYLVDRFNAFAVTNPTPETLQLMFDQQLSVKGLLGRTSAGIRSSVQASGNSQALATLQEWLTTNEELSAAIKLTDEQRTLSNVSIEALSEEVQSLEKELSHFFPHLTSSATWEDVQAQLEPNEAAIEIIRLESGDYFALLLSQTTEALQLIPLNLTTETELSGLRAYRNAIKFKIEDRNSYDLFWQPIAAQLESIDRIYLSPDGVYHLLNPNTFRIPNSEDYLIDRLSIVRVSNSADLTKTAANDQPANAIIFGNPQFDLGHPATEEDANTHWSRALNGTAISPLPGTKIESEQIDQLLRSNDYAVNSALGPNADEAALKQIQSPGILHIATHGFFLPQQAGTLYDQNFLALETTPVLDHPLMRSGLLLSGSQQTINGRSIGLEDGIFTSFEASLLRLHANKLTVLSACETGLGEIQNGEGVFGLQRAFQMAGSQNILMSLWKVDDAATQLMMTTFYARVTSGQTYQAALTSAQQAVRTQYPEPYFWGSFILLGLD